MAHEVHSDDYQLCAVILLDGSDTRVGRRFNELDLEYHKNQTNGSITVHYAKGIRAKIEKKSFE